MSQQNTQPLSGLQFGDYLAANAAPVQPTAPTPELQFDDEFGDFDLEAESGARVKSPPPQAEVMMVWNDARPILPQDEVAAWLRRRKIDPEVINRLDLARVLHKDQALPLWAGFKPSASHPQGRSWFEAGFVLVMPLCDHTGAVRSLIARTPTPQTKRKSVAALGFGRKGLCFAGSFDRLLLSQAATKHINAAESIASFLAANIKSAESLCVLAEGEMDYLAWATSARAWGVIGMFGGGFDGAWALALRKVGRPLCLRGHAGDGSGIKMMLKTQAQLALAGFGEGTVAVPGPDFPLIDENDQLIKGILPSDPRAGLVPWDMHQVAALAVPSPPPPEAPDRANLSTTPPVRPPVRAARQNPRLTRDERQDRFSRIYVERAMVLAATEASLAREGNRNDALFAAAANIARFQHTPYLSVTAFRDVFVRVGVNLGLDKDEVRICLLSAWSAAKGDPARIEIPQVRGLVPQAAGEGEGGLTDAQLDAMVEQLIPASAVKPPADVSFDFGFNVDPMDEAERVAWDAAVRGDRGITSPPQVTEGGAVGPVQNGSSAPPDVGLGDLPTWSLDEVLNAAPLEDSVEAILSSPAKARREITTEIAEMTDGLLADLAAHSKVIFERDGKLVRVLTPTKGRPHIDPLPLATMREFSSRATEWVRVKFDKDGCETFQAANPPQFAMDAALNRSCYPGFAQLKHLALHPIVLSSGTILTCPGYHKNSGVLLCPAAPYDPINLRDSDCTKEAAQAALADIKDLFRDCDFEHPSQVSAAISVLFTFFTRQNYATVPLFALDASTPGTGKSTVFQIIQIIAMGTERLTVEQALKDENEEAKRLLSAAMEGKTGFMIFDNVKGGGSLGNAVLDGVLTSGRIGARVLSTNTTAEADLNVIPAATGNNMRLSGDLARRTIFTRLRPPPCHPDFRDWHYKDIVGHTLRHRTRYLRAALLILRAYHLAGSPEQNHQRMSNYERWTQACRDPLAWLGEPDFVAMSRRLTDEVDTSTVGFGLLLQSLVPFIGMGVEFTLSRLQSIWRSVGTAPDPRPQDQDFVAACVSCGLVNDTRWKSNAAQGTLSSYQGRDVGGLTLVPVKLHRSWMIAHSKGERASPKGGAAQA